MEPAEDTRTTRDPRSTGGVPGAVWILGAVAAIAGAVALSVAAVVAVGPSMVATAATSAPLPAPPDTAASGFAVWAVNDDGQPVRWDPCRPIEVVLSPDGAPAGAATDLDEALSRLRAASGLDLVLTGTTDERPSASRLPYQPERYGDRWAPILVAWERPGASGLPLRDTDRGVAIPVAGGPEGDRTYLTAQVVLNRDRTDLRPGFGDRAEAWGATLLHELLHALGLDHVDDPGQLMATYPGRGAVELGDGDLAGLDAIGAAAGCRPVPRPAPVRVAPARPDLPGHP